MMDINGKTVPIRYKIITKEVFSNIINLFKKEAEKLQLQGNFAEILFQITTDGDMYSGPNCIEFESQYKHKHIADNINITLYVLETPENQQKIKNKIFLQLDRKNDSYLHVAGKDNTWVNGVVTNFSKVLGQAPNRNKILHNPLLEMLVQILIVVTMVVFSIFVAAKLSSKIQVQYAEVYIFVVVLLSMSNLWDYGKRGLILARNKYYPIVDIRPKPRKRIIIATGTFVVSAIVIWFINHVLDMLTT